jgi:2-polyprenyl-6-methoxyphenol hydroxylase-like FAD-dependent oxidoreductase
MPETQVLIVGAGPTGLLLALWLVRSGVRVRIVDKAPEPGSASRALAVQARTLEFYRQLDLSETLIANGLEFAAANLWVRGRKVGHVPFGAMGKGLSPFPYMLIYPQDEHERLLIERLAERGVTVERPTEFFGFAEEEGRVRCRLRLPDGSEETCTADYLAGCDGAHSAVREALRVGFQGGTYDHLFYVADVRATGPVMDSELHVALDEADFLASFPMKGAGRARLIGTMLEADHQHQAASWDSIRKDVIDRLRITVENVNWFSTYHVHHRVADRFRSGRAFLLGDAAHIHSPVGGQGMNTGLGDAVNLAWKLASVLQDRAGTALLDTYEPERMAFAQRLVATTDRAFTIVTSSGPLARLVRLHVVPWLLPTLFAMVPARRFMFRTISQIAIEYRRSSLSEGRAGGVHGGDRLPWVPREDGASGRDDDNFTPLTARDWQVHVYGNASSDLVQVCRERGLVLNRFAWGSNARRAGLEANALYLVRPDGYVALADSEARTDRLTAYLETRGIRPANGDLGQAAS